MTQLTQIYEVPWWGQNVRLSYRQILFAILLIALLLRVYSDRTPEEILDAEPFFIEEIGLKEHLSPTRANGLLSMVKQIKLLALAQKARSNR